ncbi:DNA-binding transcriptional LysR family regulator [Leucobacter komagatae]|uniref:DNA-binding transcriptional LysR family regulator n=1 Tax=Leucobacter komagatae TaxID=55969 RepID=A0A542Y6D4_9MICO|nr:LysR family transcriptional regulator [Leucobacter komagatae]TQL43623.1 DNA-binding transcriptional LysR family regulator [Leucobacter komagatae]
MRHLRPDLQPEALMTFLAVARLGRYTAAADSLGINHSTVSRRLAALEESLGDRVLVRTPNGWELTDLGHKAMLAAEEMEAAIGRLAAHDSPSTISGLVRIATPDAFGSACAIPALARVQERHPDVAFEVIAATQRVRQHRSGVDVEIVVGKPEVYKASALRLSGYRLALYATDEYLRVYGEPLSLDDLSEHRLIYYVESALQVDELDAAHQRLPLGKPSISSTSVFAHVSATLESAGIGILPDYLAEQYGTLRRVLPTAYEHPVEYWAVVREEGFRKPAVALTIQALVDHAGPQRPAASPATT